LELGFGDPCDPGRYRKPSGSRLGVFLDYPLDSPNPQEAAHRAALEPQIKACVVEAPSEEL
jgi:hypothetical protein